MRKPTLALLIVAATLCLAACGKKGDVKPPRDHSSATEIAG